MPWRQTRSDPAQHQCATLLIRQPVERALHNAILYHIIPMMSRLALGREQLRQLTNIEELSCTLEDGSSSWLRADVRSGRQTTTNVLDSAANL